MVNLTYFMFVVAILAAILVLWTSFAIKTYPLIFPEGQNVYNKYISQWIK